MADQKSQSAKKRDAKKAQSAMFDSEGNMLPDEQMDGNTESKATVDFTSKADDNVKKKKEAIPLPQDPGKEIETIDDDDKTLSTHHAPPRRRQRGIEKFRPENLVIPYCKLVQPTSKEAIEGDVKPGSFVNNLTDELLAKAKNKDNPAEIEIIVIDYFEGMTMFPPRKKEDAGSIASRCFEKKTSTEFKNLGNALMDATHVICRSRDAKNGVGMFGPNSDLNSSGRCEGCIMSTWRDANDNPPCSFYHNYFVIVRGHDFPVPLLLTMGRTSKRAGSVLGTFLKGKLIDTWNFAYKISSVFTTNDKGKFYVLSAKPGGKATEEEIEKGELFFNLINSSGVEVEFVEEEIIRNGSQPEAATEAAAEEQTSDQENIDNPDSDDDVPF